MPEEPDPLHPEPRRGPLTGVRVLELGGIGPGPFAGCLLADLGADVVKVDRPRGPRLLRPGLEQLQLWDRGKRSIALDMTRPDGRDLALELAGRADAVIDPFRPGVAERLGLGPDDVQARNPRVVYGRMTGWGQEGPLRDRAGHDINYVASAGALFHLGRAGAKPTVPLNLVGDFGGGGMLLVVGLLSGLLEAGRSGVGQVVDAAMVDGVAAQMLMFHALAAMGDFDEDRRGENVLDSGAHFYEVYECSDGEFVAVGAVEPQFYRGLLAVLGIVDDDLPAQFDPAGWDVMKDRLAAVFRTRTRQEWCERLEGLDVCVTPVLRMSEAATHPHHRARGTFVEVDGVVQPAPAPRFSRTPGGIRRPPPGTGQDGRHVLVDWLRLDPPAAAARLARATPAPPTEHTPNERNVIDIAHTR